MNKRSIYCGCVALLGLNSAFAGVDKVYSPTVEDEAKIQWQLGILFGLDDETSDSTLRWQLEYEF